MKKYLQSLLILALVFSISSCMTTKTTVGGFKSDPNKDYVYATGKQVWVFWGLVPLGRTNVNTPPDGHCEIITKYRPGDVLVSILTLGIVTTYSIKVKAKRKR